VTHPLFTYLVIVLVDFILLISACLFVDKRDESNTVHRGSSSSKLLQLTLITVCGNRQ
jgi:hypothetical protein